MRSALILALVLAGTARAEHCAPPSPGTADGLGVRLSAAAEVRSFATDRFEGELQGGLFAVSWAHPWVRLRATQPVYRVVRNGLESNGPGDLTLDAWAAFLRLEDERLAAGVRLSASAPLGDDEGELGMGHTMLALGLWVDAPLSGAVWVHAEVGYARALVADLNEHAHGPRPLVDPMNASEVTGSATVTVPLGVRWTLAASLFGAVPAGIDAGEARASLSLGGTLHAGPVDVGLSGALPLVGDPFEGSLRFEVGVNL